jgi:phage baseplate assembly protein W
VTAVPERLDLDYPFHVDRRGRTAETDFADHVRDMVEQLLLTRPGERVNRPDFGCTLLDLLFAPNSPELAAATALTAQAALQRFLGDVLTVSAIEASADDSTLRIEISYVITATGEERTEVIEGSAG